MMTLDLGGVFVPAITPFDGVTGDLDILAMRANVRRWLAAPIRGIVVAGSTGEAVLLSPEERVALLQAVREIVPPHRLLLAGAGAESTRQTIRLAREAAGAGVDAVLVQPPSFYRDAMDGGALARHYRTVADASPVPVLLYQVPLRFSTIELPAGLVAELSAHPNIVGMKDSRGELEPLGDLLTQAGRGFQILVGSANALYASLEMGAVGGILAVANLAPAECCALARAAAEGRASEAGRIQERIGPLGREIVGKYGVPGVKAGLDLLGARGGSPRPPLQPLGERARQAVREVLVEADLLDTPRAPV